VSARLSSLFSHRYPEQMNKIFYQIGGLVIGCILLLTVACKKKFSPHQTQDVLKRAWLNFLEKGPNFDSTVDKFEVLDVSYYEDSTLYLCEFKVRMKIPSQHIDTIGMMNGTISRDFTVVHRKY